MIVVLYHNLGNSCSKPECMNRQPTKICLKGFCQQLNAIFVEYCCLILFTDSGSTNSVQYIVLKMPF